MIKLLFSSIILFLCIYPLAKARKNIITENELYGIFLGNYIYFIHYLLMLSCVLCVVHYLIVPISKKALCLIIPATLIIVGGLGYYNYRNATITHTKISIDKPALIESLKIAFVADLHLTTTSNTNLFVDMVEKIQAQQPDIIIFGGDIIQNSYTKIKDDYTKIFQPLKAKYGVYTVLGNHEYYGNDVEENIKYLQSLGVKVLRDVVLNIDGIHIIARDDVRRDYVSGQRKSLQSLFSENNISPNTPTIVVDHNPQSILESVAQKADIQLSAHTHAGQFFPYNMLLKARLPNAYGYKKIEELHTVVTSGVSVGFWKIIGPWQMPYRFGTRSEINIVEIDFLPKKNKDK